MRFLLRPRRDLHPRMSVLQTEALATSPRGQSQLLLYHKFGVIFKTPRSLTSTFHLPLDRLYKNQEWRAPYYLPRYLKSTGRPYQTTIEFNTLYLSNGVYRKIIWGIFFTFIFFSSA